jgi:hypothetical protein
MTILNTVSVDLVYLAWIPLGIELFERFFKALKCYDPGIPIKLVIVYNGYKDKREISPFHKKVSEYNSHICEIYIPGYGWDILSYRHAATCLTSDYICFLNTYSQPQVAGWLEALLRPHLSGSGIKLTGASGSFTSAFWCLPPTEPKTGFSRLPIRGWLQRRRYRRFVDRQLRAFPKEHQPFIRTNGFMINRQEFIGLKFPSIVSKFETIEFESGWNSMTRQVINNHGQVGVVGKNGECYAPTDWPTSRTYSSFDQENLLISDNRTDAYQNSDNMRREDMNRRSYGYPPVEHYEPYNGCWNLFKS